MGVSKSKYVLANVDILSKKGYTPVSQCGKSVGNIDMIKVSVLGISTPIVAKEDAVLKVYTGHFNKFREGLITEKRIGDVKKGDFIVSQDLTDGGDEVDSNTHLFLVAYYLVGGFLFKEGDVVCFKFKNRDIIEKLKEILENQFFNYTTANYADGTSIMVKDTELYNTLKKYGMRNSEKFIHSDVLFSSSEIKKHVLRVLLLSNKNVDLDKKFFYPMHSMPLAMAYHKLFASFGIYANILESVCRGEEKYNYIAFSLTKKELETAKEVICNNKDLVSDWFKPKSDLSLYRVREVAPINTEGYEVEQSDVVTYLCKFVQPNS